MYWHLHGHSSSCFCFHLIHYANVGYPVAEGTVQLDFSDFAFTLPADDTPAARILNENPATIVGNILFGIIPVTQALNVMFYVSTGTFQRYCVKGHLFLENWSKKSIATYIILIIATQYEEKKQQRNPKKFDCFANCEIMVSCFQSLSILLASA